MKRFFVTGGSGFIGTHLLDRFLDSEIDFVNVDIAEPKKERHFRHWHNCNILDAALLESIFREYQPTHVVHLAARARMEGKSLEDFRDNTVGTANVLDAIKKTPSVSHVVITSSQHVRKPGTGFPKDDFDFVPHGLYGESKVITEKLTHEADLSCVWTIIRPTTVWGPGHPFLPQGLWKLMRKGMYFHPYNDPVVRSYGYVKNVVWQIDKLLNTPADKVNRKMFYVGELPLKQIEWINAFSKALTNHGVLQVPVGLIYMLALVGNMLKLIGLRFPMDSSRYFNLTTTNPVPLDPIIDLFGIPPYSMAEGISETIQWLDWK